MLDFHVTALFVAVFGLTTAESAAVLPIPSVIELRLILTLLTGIVTFTLHVALTLPSGVFAVIVTEPAAIPLTTPFELTVAIFLLLEDHVIFLLVAFAGAMVY